MFKLVLVDDEPMIAEQLSLAYDWHSFEFEPVAFFTSGKAVLNYIEKNPVDALITDVKMPHVTGLDLARICYETYPQIGVVLVSAYRDFDYAHRAIQYNVVDYLLKPICDENFTKTMNKLRTHLINQERIVERPSAFSNNMIIQEAVSFIHEHYSENITAETVARHVMISPEYFGVYFKKHFGENFIDFLRSIRMKAAKELLQDESLTVSAISERVGYKSPTHFYENFQNFFGQTPSAYRKSLQSKHLAKKETRS